MDAKRRLDRAAQLHLDARAERVRAEKALSALQAKEATAHQELVAAREQAGLVPGYTPTPVAA